MTQITHKSGRGPYLLQGNEAIARGGLEAGAVFYAGYPGNPSSEIIERLAEASRDLPIYVEWSINEKVALEAATAASFAGCRAMVSMKQNGVNVASDFLTNLTLSGTKGGLVLVTCDDPGGISSTNEEDARLHAKLADIPLLEPATPQEALEMSRWAFELSEKIENVVMLRSVSRLSHTRADVVISDLPDFKDASPFFDVQRPFHTFPVVTKHLDRHRKLAHAESLFEHSPFNHYSGPASPELIVISPGCASTYVGEALEILGIREKVGVFKVGTTWPLPKTLFKKILQQCDQFLFIEEVDPFLEDSVKALASDFGTEIGPKAFKGKASGHFPPAGEQSPGMILEVLGCLFKLEKSNSFREKMLSQVRDLLVPREYGFCPGCPHRGSFYAIKTALTLDNRNGFVSGDIGCYTMGIWPTGFNQIKSVHAMGSGVGAASGYGKLPTFGFDQPVVTVCGDSTFFHAGIPALINARFNLSDIFLIILDNSATAMTGFQPHPGTDSTAMGQTTEPVDIKALCESLGVHVEEADPYDPDHASRIIYDLIRNKGIRVLLLRRKCALVQNREGGFPYRMHVAQDRCLGEDCGCGRFCTRIFRCPGLVWDKESRKAEIDEVICVGCGVCADICPQNAIERHEK